MKKILWTMFFAAGCMSSSIDRAEQASSELWNSDGGQCEPLTCADYEGWCGNKSDGCGLTIYCGCDKGLFCGADARCHSEDDACGSPACGPDSCGLIPDACTGDYIDCGGCGAGEYCTEDNECVTEEGDFCGSPSCGPDSCGLIPDACTGDYVDCGGCSTGFACSEANICERLVIQRPGWRRWSF